MSKLDTLWYTRCPVPTPVGIAVQLGWIEEEFAGEGLKLGSVRDSADRSVRASHFDHNLDNSFRQGGSIPAIWARAAGRPTKLVGLTWTDEAQVILSLPESKIRTIKDLKGRRLGIATRPRDSIDFWKATTLRAYLVALALEGLTEKDVELVEIPRPEASFDAPGGLAGQGPGADELLEVQALKAGKVDVVFHKGSRGLEVADAIGAHVVFDVWEASGPARALPATTSHADVCTVDSHLPRQPPGHRRARPSSRTAGRSVGRGKPDGGHPVPGPRDRFHRAMGASRLWQRRKQAPEDRPRRVVGSGAR